MSATPSERPRRVTVAHNSRIKPTPLRAAAYPSRWAPTRLDKIWVNGYTMYILWRTDYGYQDSKMG